MTDIRKSMRQVLEEINSSEIEKLQELALDENTDAAIRKKAEKSGMPFGILKKVFNRGVAAWKGGHRPGTNPTQWGLARVNSFVTKSSGTWGKADSDLAAKVRGKSEETIREDGHTDVASAKNQVQIAMSALQKMQTELDKLGDEDELPTWWTNKVAVAVDKLDGSADYLDTKVEGESNE